MVEKNKKDFDYLPIIKGINILLNCVSMPLKNKLYFEFNQEWYLDYFYKFKAYGFTTDDIDLINNLTKTKIQNQNYYSRFEITSNLNSNSNNGNSDKTTDIIPLEVKKEDCFMKTICKGYIIKNDIDLKMVVLKVPEGSKNLRTIQFRYGNEEYIPPETYDTTMKLGFILALPNIIFYIVKKCQKKMTASKCTLAMNIMLNFAYGNLFGYLFKLGGENSKQLGESLLGLYILICIVSIYRQKHGHRTYFDVVYNLSHKIVDSKSLNEVINYNRKLYPKVMVGCSAQHEESREIWDEYKVIKEEVNRVEEYRDDDGHLHTEKKFSHFETKKIFIKSHYSNWGRVDEGGGRFLSPPGKASHKYEERTETRTVETFRKELEYKYTSWQDNTENINNIKYCPIIDVYFSHIFYFDETSENILAKMKRELKSEAYKYDTNIKSYEIFTVPNFSYTHVCCLDKDEYQRIKNKYNNKKGYIMWTISFLLGYSSIFETFARYEIGKEKIKIGKTISKRNDKRASYFKNDTNLPEISISFVRTELQNKILQKKVEKGEIDDSDKDIPLIIVK